MKTMLFFCGSRRCEGIVKKYIDLYISAVIDTFIQRVTYQYFFHFLYTDTIRHRILIMIISLKVIKYKNVFISIF